MTDHETSDDETDWRRKINDVRSLLDRLKEERQAELNQQNEDSLIQSRDHEQPEPPAVLPKKWKQEKENRGILHTPMDNKHGLFIAEIHEKAELISKSVKKDPKRVLHAIEVTSDEEDKEDSEKEEYLSKIRAAPTNKQEIQVSLPITLSDVQVSEDTTETETAHREVTELEIPTTIDLNAEPEITFILNVGVQKNRAALGKQGLLKGRRRPDAVQRRSRVLSSASSDGMDFEEVKEVKEQENKDEQNRNEIEVYIPGLKSPPAVPQKTKSEERRIRGKSMPTGGVATPVLSEIILQNSNQVRNRNSDAALQQYQNTAELVASAARRKQQQAVKEEKMESIDKPAEKPSWVVEMEARRRRREMAMNKSLKPEDQIGPSVPPRPKSYDISDSTQHISPFRTITLTSSTSDEHVSSSTSPSHSPRQRISSDEEGKENGHPKLVHILNKGTTTPTIEVTMESKSAPKEEDVPQWKKDLLQKKKRVSTKVVAVNGLNQPHKEPVNQGIVVLPQWKQDLMERQRQSRDQAFVKKSDDIPAWKKQLNERRKSKPAKVETKQVEPVLSEFDKKMAERQKLADRVDAGPVIQASLVSDEIIKDEDRPVPSFMKEFEKGKRRVVTVSSYIKKPESDNEPEFFKMRRNIRTVTKYQT